MDDILVHDIPLWLFRLLEASQLSDLREGGRGDDRQNRCIFKWYLIYLQFLSNRYCNSTCHWVVQDIFSHPRWGYDPNWSCSSDYSLLGVVRLTPASRSFPRNNFGHQLVVFHTFGLGVDQLVLAGMGGIRAIDTFVDRRRWFVDRWLYFLDCTFLEYPRIGCWMMMGTFKNVRNPIGTRYIWRDFGAPGGTEKVQWKSRLKWRQGPPSIAAIWRFSVHGMPWYELCSFTIFYIRCHIPIISVKISHISYISQPFSSHASQINISDISLTKIAMSTSQVAKMPWLAQFLGWHITRWHQSHLWWYVANPLFFFDKNW